MNARLALQKRRRQFEGWGRPKGQSGSGGATAAGRREESRRGHRRFDPRQSRKKRAGSRNCCNNGPTAATLRTPVMDQQGVSHAKRSTQAVPNLRASAVSLSRGRKLGEI